LLVTRIKGFFDILHQNPEYIKAAGSFVIIHICFLEKIWYTENRNNKMLRHKNENNPGALGFTLIELLVVISIIALLSSVALIAFQSARTKSRNVKRLSDMTQMNTALELYFATNKGYPSSSGGVPQGIQPQYASTIPLAPEPPDGVCVGLNHGPACVADDSGCANVLANTYYYIALGSSYNIAGISVYPSYTYYFCLGAQTGNFSEGERILTPSGVK
jgi:prepilin-type N-terminal cleavage/methylation domain-containing protein